MLISVVSFVNICVVISSRPVGKWGKAIIIWLSLYIYDLLILARLRLVLNFHIFPSPFSVGVRTSDLDATIFRKKMYCPIFASDSVSHETPN